MTPKFLNSEIIFSHFLTVIKEQLLYPNGHLQDHYKLTLPSPVSVSILALTSDHQLVINDEYRGAVQKFVLSLPGGLLNRDEDPLQGAARELLEETGYTSPECELIGESYPMPGIADQKVYYVLMKNVQKVQKPTLDPSEIIHSRLLTTQQLKEEIRSHQAVDGILLAGLFFFGCSVDFSISSSKIPK